MLLEFLKDVAPRVIFLLVSKAQVPHVFADEFDAVRVFTPAASPSDFLDAADNPEGYVEDEGRLPVRAPEVDFVVSDCQRAPDRTDERTEVSHISGCTLDFLSNKKWCGAVIGSRLLLLFSNCYFGIKISGEILIRCRAG